MVTLVFGFQRGEPTTPCYTCLTHRISSGPQPVIEITLDILVYLVKHQFSKTNVQKSNVFPIQSSELDTLVAKEKLPCEVPSFPCKYLGIPLSLRKLTRAQLQPLIDKTAYLLPAGRQTIDTGWETYFGSVCAHFHFDLSCNGFRPPTMGN